MAKKARKPKAGNSHSDDSIAEIVAGAAGVVPSKPHGDLSHFERYEIVELHRSEIHGAPYNPRVISAKAREKLKKGIERFGLVEPLIVNRASGNTLVGGHQRMSILDTLHGTKDYRLRVALVDLDSKAEKELNVFLNNEGTQGEWDVEKLELLFKEDKIGIEEAGYDLGEMYQMFGDSPLIEQPEELEDFAERIRAAKERYESIAEKSADRDDVDFYMVLVFASDEDRAQFADVLGTEDAQFVDGREIWKSLTTCGAVAGDETAEEAAARRTTTVKSCPRCSAKHDDIDFRPLTGEADTYFGTCPATWQPILLPVGDLPPPETDVDETETDSTED
jgi:hypothetical protein